MRVSVEARRVVRHVMWVIRVVRVVRVEVRHMRWWIERHMRTKLRINHRVSVVLLRIILGLSRLLSLEHISLVNIHLRMIMVIQVSDSRLVYR